MKLSNETVSVLKNFSTINQNLVIKSGNKIATMSAMKNIVAKAEVLEEFPQEFAIYDLNEFLSAISLFSKPELEFENDFVMITEEGTSKSLKYWYSDPSVVTTPTKDITMPECEVKFNLSSDTLSTVTKAAAVIGAPDMALESGSLKVTDKKNDTANNYALDLDVDSQSNNYKFWFKVENLKLIQGSYDVQVSSKNISHFKNSTGNVEYFIALEPESAYNA
tara:strand:+ start:2060 stop:2722 length:663 start_codon:yes stop_codon:yes gene_type:complete